MIEALIIKTIEETCERVLTKLLDGKQPQKIYEDDDPWLTSAECAAMLKIHPDTARRKIREAEKAGLLAVHSTGGKQIRIRKSDLSSLLQAKAPPKENRDDVLRRMLEKR